MAKYHQLGRQKGLTLIEIMVAIGLLAILSLVLVGSYLGTSSTYLMIQGRLDVNQEARRAMENLIRDLRMATGVSIALDNNAFESLSYTDRNGNSVTYRTEGGAILRNDSPVARYIASFIVEWEPGSGPGSDDDKVIRVSIQTQTQDQTHDLETTVTLRNP